MPNTSSNLSFLLDEIVSALSFEAFYEEPFMMPVLFGVRGSSRRRERTASFGGLTTWAVKTPSQEPTEDNIEQQFEKDFIHTAYGKQVPVERELIDDEEFGLLEDLGAQLGVTAALTMERKAVEIFDDSFAGAIHTAEDGKSLNNAAHTNKAGGNSQSNTGVLALSFNSVETTRVAMRDFLNYDGEKLSVRPRLILVPTALEQTGWEIVKSVGKPGVTTNDLNFYNGMFDMMVWDFLADPNNWWMMDPRLMQRNLLWYQRIGLEIFGDGNLFTGTRRLGGYMRFSHGSRDWRWIFGNEVP